MNPGRTEETQDPKLQEKVRPVLNRVDTLPTLPPVVTRILALVEDPKATGQQVADTVSMDQAMVAAILKIVNSPFYGLNRRISSISHAILLLGFRTIRNMALSATLLNTFGGQSGNRRFDRGHFWRHSVGCATTARLLAKRLRIVDPEEAFLTGLIHDMGRIVFDHYFTAEFGQVIELAGGGNVPLLNAECEIFGLDHTEVGRLIAQKWNFPATVAEAIGAHHDPSKARLSPPLAAVVHVADDLSHHAQDKDYDLPPRGPFDPTTVERIGLTPSMLEELTAELEVELEKAEVFLNVLR